MDADWDLQAVVRGCFSAVSTSSATTTTTPSWPENTYTQEKSTHNEENLFIFPDLFQPRTDNSIEHFLNDLYNPLYFQNIQNPPPSSQNFPISPLSVLGGLQDPPYHHHNQHQQQQQQQQQEKQFHGKQQSLRISRCTTSNAQSTTKFKKRKNQIKKVCHVPVEGSPPSSDLWSWRKYGQKPIKGSPFPRGYYKCSTSKGCLARKQVERNRSDPGILIISYTGEHSHPVPSQRNSSAGSSRNKTKTSIEDDNLNKPTPSSPFSPVATLSPAMEKINEFEFELDRDYTDDDNLDASGIVIDEDIFDGLDDFVGSATGDIISGRC